MPKKQRVSLANQLRVGADYLDGFSYKEIANRNGLESIGPIARIAERLGIPQRNVKLVLLNPKTGKVVKTALSPSRKRGWETRRQRDDIQQQAGGSHG